MKAIAIVALSLALAGTGCTATSGARWGTTAGSDTLTTTSAGVVITTTSEAAVAFAGVIAVGALFEAFYTYAPFGEYQPRISDPLPELLEGRRINEQDCRQPIVDPTANLRCR